MTRLSNVAFLLFTFALSSSIAVGTPEAFAQTKDQQNCINALNKAGAKVAQTQGKENSGCIKAAGAGKLINPSTDICVTADNKGKMLKATGKTTDAQTKKCSSPFPTFAYTDPTTINTAAANEELALLQAVFGTPVDPVMLTDKAGAKCQSGVSKAYEKLGKTRLKSFLTCKKNGLKDGAITNATQLEPCMSDDPKFKVDKAAGKLTDTITKSCAGVTLATAFPGCSAEAGSDAALSACVKRNVECHSCLMVNAMDDLAIGCDQHDDGLVNATCRQCGNSSTEAPEACDDGGDSPTCDSDCTAASCGDGYTNAAASEACDDSGESATCDNDCTLPVCGDNVLNTSAGEVCDDGGLVDGDGCDSNCTVTGCGNGVTTAGEACDDGGDSPTCDSDCTVAACGDGYINGAAGETCDDSGESASCDADCTAATCGDGVINASAGELCDDGNTDSGDGCSSTCVNGPGSGENDPLCPSSGELTLYSKLSNVTCANNGDCTAPRTCDPTLLLCTTVAELDSGWNGAGHDGDVDDGIATRATLLCEGPAGPGCGECEVTGLDPTSGNCRCANDILTKCDEPFAVDNDDCGGNTCNCYFGAPFPLAAEGTPVCVSNRFSENITGTADVDLGSGQIAANLRTQVFLGITTDLPCPVCGGQCSDDNSGCIFDSDCTGPATCVQDTPGDGIRDGKCVYDPDFHTDNGVACDADGTNASFPAVLNNTVPGDGGGSYSIDCQPEVGKNVSGQGLKISLTQSTGTNSLGFGVDCDGDGVGTDLCPCLTCSKDDSEPCSSDADCLPQGGSCDLYDNPTTFECTSNADCTGVDLGTCTALGNTRCSLAFGHACTVDADCQGQSAGNCALSTCSSDGGGTTPQPNLCADDICTDQGGGEGECLAGPASTFCDALVRADGTGINSCNTNADCLAGYGDCTLVNPADCFLDPIEANGSPDPVHPVAGAVFCIPATSNSGINDSAGLPGPGRVISQGAARTFCASNPLVEYTPGGAPACP